MATGKEAGRHYTPIADVVHTWGLCKTKHCYTRGDLGDGVCVNCWDRRRDKPTIENREKGDAKQ